MLDDVGKVVGEREHVDLARLLAEHAALGDAGRLLGADEVEHGGGVDRLAHVDAQQVDVDRLAAHRVVLDVLDDHRGGLAAVDGEVEDRARVRERRAQDARVDREGLRLVAAAVDDAGDETLAAQPAGGARPLDGAGGDLECGVLRTCHGGRRW